MPNVTFSFSWCDKFQSISTGNSENNTTLRISKHDKKLNHIVTRKNNIFIYFHIFILYQLTSLMLRQFNRAINNVNNLIRKIVFTYGTFVFFVKVLLYCSNSDFVISGRHFILRATKYIVSQTFMCIQFITYDTHSCYKLWMPNDLFFLVVQLVSKQFD